MAYDNEQNESPLPANGTSNRKSANHLPRYYRTPANTKFLSSTLDQLTTPGVVEKINGYVGRKTAKAYNINDNYVADYSSDRENYQFEPAAIIRDSLNNISFYKDYNDYIGQLNSFGKGVTDHSVNNSQEYYAWNPHIDWDKFSNFREYYWLPNGPQTVTVVGNTVDIESTIKVTVGDNVDNNTYVFSNEGTVNNPTLTLYRGQTYEFEVDTPNMPFTIKTQRTLNADFNLDSSSILVLEGVSLQNLEKGKTKVKLDDSVPDILYYVNANDINAAGTIIVKDIEEATFIDVEKEILGKRFYKTAGGFSLSNGMKITFGGTVVPEKYASNAWYVEGVGESIKLINENVLNVPSSFSADVVLEFDDEDEGFDRLPYSSAIGYPITKDYLVINRSSVDGNLWSRYNRWFHRDVIEKSAEINNQPVTVDQNQRAKRPIVEFSAGIKLDKFGTFAKGDVDLVDNFTKDVFSTIEGSEGYNIDGIDVADGMRILFTADTDILVSGKIYQVEFLKFSGSTATNQRQIRLVETDDSSPFENEVILVKQGNTFSGKMFYYNGTSWALTQDKTQVNQPPLFDIFDDSGNSYADNSIYEATTFTGTKIFSYKQGTGANDSELGFPVAYRNIENVGDIVYNFNLLQDSFTYTIDNEIQIKNTDIGYLRIYNDRTTYKNVNGWEKADADSDQPIVRQYVFDNTSTTFEIDVYEESASIANIWKRVYLNNNLQFENIDYNVSTNVNNNLEITFNKTLNLGDNIIIKTKASSEKTDQGFYEIPINLERNPENKKLQEFTLGEVNDHVNTIAEGTEEFVGVYPGKSNLRDLGNLSKFGRRFVQHSSPINLSLYHIVSKDSNIVKSIEYARKEYSRFKREFLLTATNLGYEGPVKEHVDRILQEITKAKTERMPFYFSDMVPIGASKKNTYTVEDTDQTFFALSNTFVLTELSRKAVGVYLNSVQLTHGKDYTFNTDGFAVITADKNVDDIIEIYEYETTNGAYVPPTPAKLGLFPSYEPYKYLDNTYQTPTNVIQGHDGSLLVAFDDYRDDLILELEKRIFNNIKVSYDTKLFDIHNFIGGEYRDTNITKAQIDKAMIKDFVDWSQFVEADYTKNKDYDPSNRFTFNHKNLQTVNGRTVSGFWRNIYKEVYDTDRPHTHPWEMLGFTKEPSWWSEVYGPSPYTKNNLILWEDLQNGVVREPNKKLITREKYKRPGLLDHIPVGNDGTLLPPIDSGLITNFQTLETNDSWIFGDGAPVETAWRRSSEYAFALLKAFVINKPSKVFESGWDRSRQIRNLADQIVYKDTNLVLNLNDLIFPNTVEDSAQIYTSGLVNYISNYMATDILTNYNDYKTSVKSIKNQLGFKIGGFTDKDKFKLILDSRTPTNEGNVFVPEENYEIFLNTSSPIETISYSGVIIEKRADGYIVKGYDNAETTFKYFESVPTENDPTINIGGVTESYLQWNAGQTYAAGVNVEYQGQYYRSKETHTSGSAFSTENLVKLPRLPNIGGRNAVYRRSFTSRPVTLNYGTLIPDIQSVVDFLLGYGAYLESKGFVFDYFEKDSDKVLNWRHSVDEFLFWTTQKWAEGSVLAVSPGASQIKFISQYSTVDNIFDSFYGYTLLKGDGKKLVEEFASLGREPNEFIFKPKNTEDGIFSIRLPLVQKEHVCVLDNQTVFNDVIYDLEPGYRQERMKILGYKTAQWDGSLNIPGFIYDNVVIEEWQSWKDYAIGDVVKYKEFYYTANNKIAGQEIFNTKEWNRLNEKPEPGLYANFEYKTNQFADFYDLDSDNFDTEQQRLAQHLIGYQKRKYLENIINDDVSQYKFYQGMIQDKGTQNSLTKLFDALASNEKDSLEFYEEWAIKDGQYGASNGFEEVEFKLDESKFKLSPQPVELVNSVTGEETDLVYRILPFDVYLKNKTYDHSSVFPSKNILNSYVKNAGYVNQQDVTGISNAYDDITEFFFTQIGKGKYIWVGNYNRDWTVFKHLETNYEIQSITSTDTGFDIKVNSTVDDILIGEVIGICDLYDYTAAGDDSSNTTSYTKYPLEGFFKISNISNDVISLISEETIDDIEEVKGSVTKFIEVRTSNPIEANSLLQKGTSAGDLVWIDDNGLGEWNVLENTASYKELQKLVNPTEGDDLNFGVAMSATELNTTLAVGSPDNEDGKVFIYTRPANSVNYVLTQTIAPVKYGDDNERFGHSVALSPDGAFLLVGSPNASNVKTKYSGVFVDTQDYQKDSVVLRNQSLWRALIDIEGAEANIQFGSFGSTTQTIEELSIENDSSGLAPVLLVGNYALNNEGLYAFPDTPVSHYLVRVPFDIYEGSGIDDEIKIAWNERTYSNQDQGTLTSRQPFNGDYDLITAEYLEETRTIKQKVDAIIYFEAATNVPEVGDLLETSTGSATVSYVYADNAETVAYLTNINGSLNTEDSIFKTNGDFVGQYVKQAPVDDVDITDVWGGYWFISTGLEYTPTSQSNVSDNGKALVFYDTISDSSATGRYYYNSLDLQADIVQSQSTIGSMIQVFSYNGAPGPSGITGSFLSNKYAIRAPKDVTDNISQGDTIDIFVNQLPTDEIGIQKDLSTINLTKEITNKTQTVYDIYDGYINFNFTKFDGAGNPFEPKVGLIVQDRTRNGSAVVADYQRNGLSATIYVKNVSGDWSLGDLFGQNAEIEFVGNPLDSGIYTVDRIMGQIQFIALGYEPANIGKMLVFEAPNNIAVPDTTRTLINAETWFYNKSSIAGIPRAANIPSPINNEWEQVYKIPADVTGSASGLVNEGLYSIYSKATTGVYDLIGSYTVPEKQANFYLGNNVKVTRFNDLYRGFIHAKGLESTSSPGRIYMIKKGDENNNTYDWEYAKNKKFKGAFNESQNYFTGDIVYLDNPAGTLYTAKTNIAAGTFVANDWTSTDDLIDYVGYIPNDTGLSVVNDSTNLPIVLDQDDLYSFGYSYDVSKNGDVIVVSALYNGEANRVVVYRSKNGFFERRQEIIASSDTIGFGETVSISDDGMFIAIGAPFDDNIKLDQGVVFIYKQIDGQFVLHQTLNSPNNERAEQFGSNVEFDGQTLTIGAKSADSYVETTFDKYSRPLPRAYVNDPNSNENLSQATFDNGFTTFKKANNDSGVVYIYEEYNGNLLFAQTLQVPFLEDQDGNLSKITRFGENVHVKNNHVYISVPDKDTGNFQGILSDFRRPEGEKVWNVLRKIKSSVDLERIKKVFLYDTKENELLTYLDYIDPLQGKIAGEAEQNIEYKTYFDPAAYTNNSNNTNVVVDITSSWGEKQVGQVWWNLTNARFYNPYQDSVIYSVQNWSKVFVGNSIDLYEWVESDILPSEWDKKADTNTGFPKGYSGTSLYGDNVYVQKRMFDGVSQTFKTKYYFWVSNKKITPNVDFRTLDLSVIKSYIEDPQQAGLRYISFISPTQFTLWNCDSLIKDKDVALSVQYYTIDNKTQNVHNQYSIISDGLETSVPKPDIIRKWKDSLVGYDEQRRPVPDPALSTKYKYGMLNNPRQGWFINKTEALKQFIERANTVLKENLIIDDKDITKLSASDPAPTVASNHYDTTVDTLDDLNFIGVERADRALLTPVVENGKIVRVIIENAGRGYKVPPTLTITGNGSDAEITISINNLGQITSAVVTNQGNNYDSSTLISVRRFTVLVNNDSTIQGKWALYERVQENIGYWNRIQSQAYDTNLFWNYIDWYATGYNDTTDIDTLIDNSYELTALENNIGDIVKISNIGAGGWLLLEKIANEQTIDYTVNYKTIGRQNGTVQLKESLYDIEKSLVGFDTISFDTKIFDNEPIEELRNILLALEEDIFIDDLKNEWNKLFFASLRYVFSEQSYVDWAYKTSFVKAKHNVGNLREDITFNNDNLPSYEAYINEVKPFSAKIREYLSAYEGLDNTKSMVTDFDLPASYDFSQKRILPQTVKVIDDTLIGVNADIETYPNKNWLDNTGYKVISAEVTTSGSKYTSPPVVKLVGGGGSGAELKAYLGRNGRVVGVDVVKQGSGYYSTPSVEINGNILEGGEEARISVTIGDSPVRHIHTIQKFDRVTGVFVHTVLSQTETFTGSGSVYDYNLKWPLDMNNNTIAVTVAGVELLGSEFSYKNVKDTSKGYDRYYGVVTITNAPLQNENIVISYKKSIDLLEAQDRINKFYSTSPGSFGYESGDLGQLMDGIDYGGVEVKSFGFLGQGGWDDGEWYADNWDTSYDTTFEDEIFELADSTSQFIFAKPLETGVQYNVYRNNIRIDDPNFGTNDPVSNPNAIMQTITGAGQTGWSRVDDDTIDPTIYMFDEDSVSFENTDVVVFRKTTSDGTFLPDPVSYDSLLSGGNLSYTTARGIAAEDIIIDGDGFVTPTTSKGPEELIPGQILDTVDIKVFDRPEGGSSPITSHVFRGDGSTVRFALGTGPLKINDVFVKQDYSIKTIETDYTLDFATNEVVFNTAPTQGQVIHIMTLGVSGSSILDIDEFVSDGSTSEFLTNVRWSNRLSYFVTKNGERVENVIFRSDDTYEVPNNVVIRFSESPDIGSVIRFAFFENDVVTLIESDGEITFNDTIPNYSEVTIDHFTADGSTTSWQLTQTPFSQEMHSWFTIVKVNDKILNAGYNKRFKLVPGQLEYKIDEWQMPAGTIRNNAMKVFLNGEELNYVTQWQFVGTQSSGTSPGSLVRLRQSVIFEQDDVLDVYVLDDGEYAFGVFDENRDYQSTPQTLQLNSAYNEGDSITVFQFSNHDTQGFERQQFDVVDRFNVTNLDDGSTIPLEDATYPDDWRRIQNLRQGLIELREEAVDAQYVWVTINGTLLTPSVHYYVTENKRFVKIASPIEENDVIEVIHFAKPTTKDSIGWRQFKDMLNRNHYKRLDGSANITLAEDLNWYDNEIKITNADSLIGPQFGSSIPAVIFLQGERIEYFVKDGNSLKQLRRGTLGTGVKDVYTAGTELYNQGKDTTIPYKDETITTIFTADGTTKTYELDFTPINPDGPGTAADTFEVFVAGKRLRKNEIQRYIQPIDNTDTSSLPIALDSPEGDETLEAEYSVNGNTLTLLNIPTENTKVMVIRKQGRVWNDPGTTMLNSNTDIANFLRATSPDLPR